MIDEKKLIADMEKLPFIHGRYDKKNANSHFINGAESMYEMIKELIKSQPKVGEWIPCSERLPEEEDTYGVVVLAPSRKEDRRSHPLPVPAALRHPAPFVEVTFKGGMRGVGYYMNGCWHSPVTELAIDVIAWKEPSEPWEGE